MKITKKLSRKLRPPGVFSRLVHISLSWFLDAREKEKVRGYDTDAPSSFSPVFIVGAPRSGSTLFYQILANELDVVYISNFVHVFSSWLNTGFEFEKRWLRKKKRYDLSSSYGGTFKAGWGAPSECGAFWYTHMPKDMHYLSKNDLTAEAARYFRQSIRIPMQTYKKPFLFKNMNAGQRIGYLKEVFPEAKFIFIQRDPLATAQSILKARNDIYGRPSAWWSIRPKEYDSLKTKDPLDQIIGQIFYIERQILEDFDGLEERDKLILSYEELCADPNQTIANVHRFTFPSEPPAAFDVPYQLRASTGRRSSEEDYQRMKEIIETYNWSTYDL